MFSEKRSFFSCIDNMKNTILKVYFAVTVMSQSRICAEGILLQITYV